MHSKTVLFVVCFCVLAGGCKKNRSMEKEDSKLVVKKNSVCTEGVVCARAEFWLNRQTPDNNKMIERMDKELIDCFVMETKGDTVLPIAVERVNYGIADEMVYVLYFENKQGDHSSDKKIIYNDRFFGWKHKEFIIERN